ncbi:MAG TPA: TerC family protein [Burkholderiales bacterium]|nr:TerC family protein [Burkholderiales bacterium]
MDLFTADFFSALVAIIIIDLVLAGDNAIVIALAARKLPKELQTRAIVWGTVGAIVVRVVSTLAVVALLRIPGLMGAGGVVLIWIAYKLLASDDEHEREGALRTEITGFGAAIRTIVIADAVMGLDNVLGVAGAAAGSYLLVVLGLLISIPIMVWGSTLILRLVDRFPAIIYIGAAVLAWTAAKMLTHEPMLEDWMVIYPWLPWVLYTVIIGGVLLGGYLNNRGRGVAKVSSEGSAGS